MFFKALTMREREGEENNIRLAKWAIARAYRSLSRYEDGYIIQRKLKREYSRLKRNDGFGYEELGELGIVLNRPDEAKVHFVKAYDTLGKR